MVCWIASNLFLVSYFWKIYILIYIYTSKIVLNNLFLFLYNFHIYFYRQEGREQTDRIYHYEMQVR